MIEVRVQGKLLTMIRLEMLPGDLYFAFMYDLVRGLYESRGMTVDTAFLIYVDHISYAYLKAFHFVEELPTDPNDNVVEFVGKNKSIKIDLKSLFDSDKMDTTVEFIKFGAKLFEIL